MRKKDKQTIEMLREEFSKQSDGINVPLKLQKQSVVKMLRDSEGKEKRYSDRYDAERLANGAEVYEVETDEQTTAEMIHELVSSADAEELKVIADGVAPAAWRK